MNNYIDGLFTFLYSDPEVRKVVNSEGLIS